MIVRSWAVVAAIAVSTGLGFGQVASDEPIKTNLCELVKEPTRFSGRMVQVRAKIASGFEESLLSDDLCHATIWLSIQMGTHTKAEIDEEVVAYAYINSRSELTHPEDLKWKPIERFRPVTLHEDDPYQMLQHYLGESYGPMKGKTGMVCERAVYCPAYAVAATLTGRFDHRELRLRAVRGGNPEEFVSASDGGFGHLGSFDSQLAMESVSDVVAVRIDPAVYKNR